jgi:hypothetical protein
MANTAHPSQPKGGQELPAEVQDRPEQNRGYDEAVRGTERAKQQQDSEGIDDVDEDDEFDDEEEGDEVEETDDENT